MADKTGIDVIGALKKRQKQLRKKDATEKGRYYGKKITDVTENGRCD